MDTWRRVNVTNDCDADKTNEKNLTYHNTHLHSALALDTGL